MAASAGPEIERLIALLAKLPGLGPRSARRAALTLLKRREQLLIPLAAAIQETADRVVSCSVCGAPDTRDPCSICGDGHRDNGLICVVEEAGALWAMERSGAFRGKYHVLGGLLSALDGIGPETLRVAELVGRCRGGDVREVVSFFDLRFVPNIGISLGLLPADNPVMRWALVLLTAGIATGVAVWMWRETVRGDVIALALVLGGALGNILDRMRFGYVVDFADLHFGEWRPFLVFNVADAAITIGVVILLVRSLFAKKPATGGGSGEVRNA